MCAADKFVVICLDSIIDAEEKNAVIRSIENNGKTIINISFYQMNHFAGNMLQVCNQRGDKFLVMSSQAYNSLTPVQISTIGSYQPIIHADITTIETNGGGSARCMMAEVFLAVKTLIN